MQEDILSHPDQEGPHWKQFEKNHWICLRQREGIRWLMDSVCCKCGISPLQCQHIQDRNHMCLRGMESSLCSCMAGMCRTFQHVRHNNSSIRLSYGSLQLQVYMCRSFVSALKKLDPSRGPESPMLQRILNYSHAALPNSFRRFTIVIGRQVCWLLYKKLSATLKSMS